MTDSVSVPIHLLGLTYIDDIAGKPIFAKEADAKVIYQGLSVLHSRISDLEKLLKEARCHVPSALYYNIDEVLRRGITQ